MKVDFLDLKRVNSSYELQFKNAFDHFLNSGWYILGNKVLEFESSFARFTDTKHCLGVANGLDAISIILKSLIKLGKIKVGDEVLVPANTFVASVLPIVQEGLRPVLVEPDLLTYNISSLDFKKKITSKSKLLLLVHLYGRNAYSTEIEEICLENNIMVIEDAAQAHGAMFKSRKVGSLGIASAFSFYPGKNLGALGDGGAITTNLEELYDVAKLFRNYGSRQKYYHEVIGINSRLDELQASFLSLKLKNLELENANRRKVALLYRKYINNARVVLPEFPIDLNEHVWHLFVVRVKEREKLVKYLNDKGIQTLIHYPNPIYKLDCFQGYFNEDYPVSDHLRTEILSLPIAPYLSIEEIGYVADTINSYE